MIKRTAKDGLLDSDGKSAGTCLKALQMAYTRITAEICDHEESSGKGNNGVKNMS